LFYLCLYHLVVKEEIDTILYSYIEVQINDFSSDL
jgi:hypothetical protein